MKSSSPERASQDRPAKTRSSLKNPVLAKVRNSIPYIKELVDLAISPTGVILMMQLEYWFDKYPDGFYKFLAPCENEKYQEGDSWIEELAFSREEYWTAFKWIGVQYKSKTEYLEAVKKGDPFKGRCYLSYHERLTGLTQYLRNHEVVDDAIDAAISGKLGKSTYGNRDSQLTEEGNPDLLIYSEPTTEPTTEIKTSSHSADAAATELSSKLETVILGTETSPLTAENSGSVGLPITELAPKALGALVTGKLEIAEGPEKTPLARGVPPRARNIGFVKDEGSSAKPAPRRGSLDPERAAMHKRLMAWEKERTKFSSGAAGAAQLARLLRAVPDEEIADTEIGLEQLYEIQLGEEWRQKVGWPSVVSAWPTFRIRMRREYQKTPQTRHEKNMAFLNNEFEKAKELPDGNTSRDSGDVKSLVRSILQTGRDARKRS